MAFYFNDLSLSGQYPDVKSFCSDLQQLLSLRQRIPWLKRYLLCSQLLASRRVTLSHNFREAVITSRDRDFIHSVLNWVGKSGPYWETDRLPIADDLFYFDEIDVTDQGLGEAARRRAVGVDATSFGFTGSRHCCDESSLSVIHGLLEQPINKVPVPNVSGVSNLESALSDAFGPPEDWSGMLQNIRERFSNLRLSNNILETLNPHPFSTYVAERTIELLKILHDYINSRDEYGRWTPSSTEILSNYFSGERARFTDESDSNKRRFKNELTFRDLDDPDKSIFCPFHGKINNPAYRIHFEWPVDSTSRYIKIVYIGPKITK